MASDVVFTMTGDEAKALRAAERAMQKMIEMGQKVDQLNAKQKQTTRATEETAQSVDKTWASFQRFAGAVGITASVAGGLALIRRELEHINRLQEQAATTQVSLFGARTNVRLNLPGLDPQQQNVVLDRVEAIARRVGTTQQMLLPAFQQAVSRSGGDVETSLRTIEQTARLAPHDAALQADFAGAAVSLSVATGTTDPDKNLGLLLKVAGLASIADPQRQAKNISPGLIGMVNNLFKSGEAGAFFSALSVATGETTGEQTATGSIKFAEELREFFTTNKQAAQLFSETEGGLQGMRSVFRQNAGLARKFVADLGGEAKVKSVLEQFILNEDSFISRKFEEFLPEFASDPAELTRRQIAAVQSDRFAPISQISREGKAALEAIESGNTKAIISTITKATLEAVSSSGAGPFGRFQAWFDVVGSRIGASGREPEDQILNVIAASTDHLRRRARALGDDPENAAMLEGINALIAAMNDLKNIIMGDIAATEANTEATQGKRAPSTRPDNKSTMTVP